MNNLSSTMIATAFAAVLIAAPAMARDGQGGDGGGGRGDGHAPRAAGGAVKSGGGGGGGAVRNSAPRSVTPNIQRSSPNVVIRQRSSGGSDRAYVPSNRHAGSANRHGEHHGNRGGHRGTRHLWGGLPFYFYDGYYHGDCGWLRRRAEATGSRYWWVRYRQCREDD